MAKAAVELDLYNPGPNVPVKSADGTINQFGLRTAIGFILLAVELGAEDQNSDNLAIRDTWRQADRPGYERSCLAAFELR